MTELALYDGSGAHGLAVVVMAKPVIPGLVKTRLTPALNDDQAAAVHGAMLRCVLERTSTLASSQQLVNMILALDYADHAALTDAWQCRRQVLGGTTDDMPDLTGWRAMAQGSGDLGARIERVWRRLGGGPAVFLGVDSPDVPATALHEAMRVVTGADHQADGAVGPVTDGGYWTLACRALAPAVLEGIDWGGPRVLEQTLAAASGAGLRFKTLPSWYDVDTPKDLAALRTRLAGLDQGPRDDALLRLRQQLDLIRGKMQP